MILVFINVSLLTGLKIFKAGGSGSLCGSLVREIETVARDFEHMVLIFSLNS